MTGDLAAFLTARLDEDEGLARAAPWPMWPSAAVRQALPAFSVEAKHISHFDPARVLREVAAKRAILASYEELRGLAEANLASNSSEAWMISAMHPTLYGVLEMLAAVYRGHPDYRDGWKP